MKQPVIMAKKNPLRFVLETRLILIPYKINEIEILKIPNNSKLLNFSDINIDVTTTIRSGDKPLATG